MKKACPYLLTAKQILETPEESGSHPFNPKSEMRGWTLSDRTGMRRVGVHLVRVPPGKESAIYHSHRTEEEFLYILSGRGIAEIQDEEYEVGPGDFMGFPAPDVAHHLRNPFDEDLVYLMGGERHEVEIGSFPRIGKILLREGRQVRVFSLDDAELVRFGGAAEAKEDEPEKE